MSDSIQAFLPLVWRHLWETTLVVGAIMILMPLLRRQRARLRHAVWLAASAKFLVPFSVLVALGISIEWTGRPTIEVPVASGPMGILPIPMSDPTPGIPQVSSTPVVLGVLVWLAGFVAVLTLWLRAQMRARGIVSAAGTLTRSRESASEFADVRVSGSVSSPAVFGLVRPVLVLPLDLERRLTPAERDAVVAHEMAHVGRRDNLTTAFHMVVTALFWFHPLVWWIGRQLVNERERASDEAVLRTGHAPEAYASGLLKICRSAVGMPAECVAGIASRNLKTRVEGIMKHHDTNRRGPLAGIVVGLMAAMTFGVPLVAGLSTPEVTLAAPLAEVERVPGPQGPDQIWVEQEVGYIITEEEREAFQSLETDEERERFIEQFWLRRDPTPGTQQNEMQDEHYRRIAYANERFGQDGRPGWQTDRGAVYIRYGEPTSREGMPLGGLFYERNQAGRVDVVGEAFPFERWRYSFIEGVGEQVVFEFVDPDATGEFRLATSPEEKFVPPDAETAGGVGAGQGPGLGEGPGQGLGEGNGPGVGWGGGIFVIREGTRITNELTPPR